MTHSFLQAQKVCIERRVALPVLDDYGVSIAALPSGMHDFAVAARQHGRAAGSRVIDTFVGPDLVQYRMFATQVEVRRDARGNDRACQCRA